jgi:hypothetical protein
MTARVRADEESIRVDNIGRCPVGVCREQWFHGERLAKIETKVWIVMLGVGAVIGELFFLIYRGTP